MYIFVYSVDESVTESILKAVQTYGSVCGQLNFTSWRDAFIQCLCKSAIPNNYNWYSATTTVSSKPESSTNHSGSQSSLPQSSSMQSLSSHTSTTGGSSQSSGKEVNEIF